MKERGNTNDVRKNKRRKERVTDVREEEGEGGRYTVCSDECVDFFFSEQRDKKVKGTRTNRGRY